MPFDQGSPQFGINDAKIATWVAPVAAGPSTYTPVGGSDIMSIQMGQVTMELVTAVLTGDDRQTAVSASAIGGTIQMRWGGLNLTTLALLTGTTIGSISSVKQVQITGGLKMPYIGIIMKALSSEVGDTWLWIPKAKITSGFTLAQMEYGAFTIPEVTMQIVDDASYGAINVVTHPTEVQITAFPPLLTAPPLT